MVKTAVILAAGLGSRMLEMTEDRPKGFLEIENKPIIEISIESLLANGIEKIIIGTGYLKEKYESFQEKFPQIQCVHNEKFATSGSMYTLYLLKQVIKDDFLLLESDLLYEKKALRFLVEAKQKDIILSSSLTNSGDEVFIEVDSNKNLVNMSKYRDELQSIHSELVGITKLSYQTFLKLCSYVEADFLQNVMIDYELALVGIAKQVNISVQKLEDLVWCEVDDEYHWNRAVSIIYPKIKFREKGILKRNVLLNPGPATTSDTVKNAQIVPDICPREDEFGEIMQFISIELTRFVANTNEYTTVLFGGSGTAAVESVISSVINTTDMLLIINNGAYGERMVKMAKIYDIDYVEFSSSFVEAINIEKLEEVILNCKKKISHLAMIHNETTTGLLNNVEQVGALCKKYNIILIVDAMSSFGAIPINMQNMNIAYLIASSNKNLQGMAGVSFVIANNIHLENISSIKPRNHYLHLYDQYSYFLKTKQMRFTPPVQTLYALKQAIIETKIEGIQARYKRYSDCWSVLIAGLNKMDLSYIVPLEHHSKIITAIIEPSYDRYSFKDMHNYLHDNGFTIYPGKFEKLSTFRVANIGDITTTDIEDFIILLEKYFASINSC